MFTLNVPDAMEFVTEIAIRRKRPVMMWGKPGVGKSYLMRTLALRDNALLIDIRLSQYDSVDLRGIPSVTHGPVLDAEPTTVGGITVWNVPATLPFKNNPLFAGETRPIYLFLDEITSGQPPVLAVGYQLTLDRRVGEHELMDNVHIIAAGNRDGDKGVTTRMPTPLANRLIHIEVTDEVDAVCTHFQSIGLPPVCIAFLQFRKALLNTFEQALKNGDKAFATARSWEWAFDFYKDRGNMSGKVLEAAMAGAVGDGPAREFLGFTEVWQKVIPISKILADPTKCPLPDEDSMKYAVAVNCSGSMDTKTARAIHTYLRRLDPEFVVMAWQLAIKRDASLFTTPEFLDFSKEYRAVFK